MASYRQRGGKWQALVRKQGVHKAATFQTKARAVAWATQVEADILAGKLGDIPDRPFGDLLRRYSREVSERKRSRRWEQQRIEYLLRDEIASVPLPGLSPEHFAAWRDRRLREVSAATILRDWNLLTHAINVAIREWKWLRESPLRNVARPAAPPPRSRRISDDEIQRICYTLGYDNQRSPETASARVAACMLFAIETAMRAGEIVALTWQHTDMRRRVCHIPKTKNGHPRDVPLSAAAIRILEHVKQVTGNGDSVFDVNSRQVDALFRKARARALIDDLHFHDTRREALTRLAEKLSVMELAKISGHRDLRILQAVYYSPSAEDLADKLDKA